MLVCHFVRRKLGNLADSTWDVGGLGVAAPEGACAQLAERLMLCGKGVRVWQREVHLQQPQLEQCSRSSQDSFGPLWLLQCDRKPFKNLLCATCIARRLFPARRRGGASHRMQERGIIVAGV